MTPYEQARRVYSQEPCARTFEEDLLLHMVNGFVFSTPKYFIMGRPVDKDAAQPLIVDPSHVFDPRVCNCWHLYLMAGDMTAAWAIMPWPLGWFSFERKNELRFYPVERIQRLNRPNLDELHPSVFPPA